MGELGAHQLARAALGTALHLRIMVSCPLLSRHTECRTTTALVTVTRHHQRSTDKAPSTQYWQGAQVSGCRGKIWTPFQAVTMSILKLAFRPTPFFSTSSSFAKCSFFSPLCVISRRCGTASSIAFLLQS